MSLTWWTWTCNVHIYLTWHVNLTVLVFTYSLTLWGIVSLILFIKKMSTKSRNSCRLQTRHLAKGWLMQKQVFHLKLRINQHQRDCALGPGGRSFAAWNVVPKGKRIGMAWTLNPAWWREKAKPSKPHNWIRNLMLLVGVTYRQPYEILRFQRNFPQVAQSCWLCSSKREKDNFLFLGFCWRLVLKSCTCTVMLEEVNPDLLFSIIHLMIGPEGNNELKLFFHH